MASPPLEAAACRRCRADRRSRLLGLRSRSRVVRSLCPRLAAGRGPSSRPCRGCSHRPSRNRGWRADTRPVRSGLRDCPSNRPPPDLSDLQLAPRRLYRPGFWSSQPAHHILLGLPFAAPGSFSSVGGHMNASQQKVVQYLNEARLSEDALVRVLQSQIAVTPRGSYRSGLEAHLSETREHAARVGGRLEALGQGSNPLMAVVGFWENVIGQTVALYKTPLDLLRGSGREQKVLKNAKDACAAEALEIATYTAIERLARSVGDDETASMAASILADEEKMLQRILREIPKLTEAVVDADVKGKPSYDVTATGAADAVREAAEREIPGVAAAAGALTGAVATAQDLPIADYDKQTAHDIAARLKGFSQRELRIIGAYEAKHENRRTITDRIAKLTGDEPWPRYDEQNVDAITTALADGDADTAHKVRSYERDHKDRAGVIDAADLHTSN